ncbi:hypothetical protein JQK87_32415 [Streptomyces sp. G44]|uniref:hypothetical protein n=1 Tax=Streptomyces sp. G44 TaxID=2807632 RepID=UPI00196073C3|nr:hypothetical protein [Streptomyces sp. G44]MBM7173017.1 hypothetical protein [Streptomyces sp. G44]
MTADLDFYATVATRGEILGRGIGSGPAAWEAALGPDHLDDPGEGTLRRDHGLVELTFSTAHAPGARSCSCQGISVQVHRLAHGAPTASLVPAALVREYGEFAPRVRFEELRSAILSLGCTVEPEDLSADIHRYRVPESGARVFVIDDPDPYGDGHHDTDDPETAQAGDVWALSVAPAWWGASP